MAVVAISQQVRILDAAGRCLGPHGEAIVREAAARLCGAAFETLSYGQIETLFDRLERDVPRDLGRDLAAALAGEIRRQCSPDGADLTEQLVETIAAYFGPSAERFLATMRSRLSGAPATLTAEHLPELAEVAEQATRNALGPESARELIALMRQAAPAQTPDPSPEVLRIAAAHAGDHGVAGMRAICRERLEVEIEEIRADGLALLLGAIEQDGGRAFLTRGMPSFVPAARAALHAPGAALRGQLIATVGRTIGPVSELLVKRVCARQGIPFDALTYEHLDGFATAVRDEVRAHVGEAAAEELRQRITALLNSPA